MRGWEEVRERAQWTMDLGIKREHASRAVFPGPVVQLFVASVAMETLGVDYRFNTRVLISDGRLTLAGAGDPTLTYRDLRSLASQVKAKGIETIDGPIMVDDTLFDDHRQGVGWFWDRESTIEQAQTGALSVNGNTADVTLMPTAMGRVVQVDLGLAKGYFSLSGHVLTAESAAAEVERVRGTNHLVLEGTVNGPTRLKVTVDDPGIYAGYLFANALREERVNVTDSHLPAVRGRGDGELVANHWSLPLQDLLAVHLPGRGRPLFYQQLLKVLGTVGDRVGTGEGGLAALGKVLAPVIGNHYRLMDGAGLSRYNLLSAEQVTRFLAHVAQYQPELAQLIPSSSAGRLLTYTLGDAAGVFGYGSDGHPLALMGFGKLEDVTAEELVQMVSSNRQAKASRQQPAEEPSEELGKDLRELLDAVQLQHGHAGLDVVDVESGKRIFSHLASASFTPASNTKLFTTAIALHYLGSDFQYSTPVYCRGTWLPDGTLLGDLVIKGVGDPCIGPDTLDRWAQRLVSAGLRTLDGHIVVDDTAFSGGILGKGWLSSLEVYGYSPQISALSYHENVVDVTIHPGAEDGRKAWLDAQPLAGYLSIDNQVTTGEGKELEEHRLAYRNHVVLRGMIPKGHDPVTVKITVEDPAVCMAKGLYQALATAGVRVRADHPVQKGVVYGQDCLLFTHSSPKLSEIVKELNKHSDNFFAEMLIRTVGLVAGGEGSAEAGIRLVHRFLDEIGMDEHPYLTDGSGLTRHNLITPRQITTLLRHMAHHPEFASYYDSLPNAGVDGTLRNRMKGTVAHDNVRAKTGTMSGVSGLSGYVTTRTGERWCFSILMNGYAEPGAFVGMQNKIAVRLAEE